MLTNGKAQINGTLYGATHEFGNDASCSDVNGDAGGPGRDVWYRFIVPAGSPAGGAYVLSLCGSTLALDTVLSIDAYVPGAGGTCDASTDVPRPTELAGGCDDESCSTQFGAVPSVISSIVLGPGTYLVRVGNWGFNETPNNFVLNVAAIGACCLSGTCSVVAPGSTGCPAGATFQGVGTTCAANPCGPSNVTCCLATGVCETVSSAQCTTDGGTVNAGSCTPTNPCPQPVTCCTGAACSSVLASACTGGGGTVSAATSCTPNPCTGACCNAGVCSQQTAAACGATNPPGFFSSLGTACAANSCPVCCRGATCNNTFNSLAACVGSLPVGSQAGAAFLTNVGPCAASHKVPCCYSNYNKDSQKSVNDIFAFLSDWFANRPAASVGGNGTTPPGGNVNFIFTFLTDWFAGGCV